MFKISLNLPIELIDFICEKINRKLLVKICCGDSPDNSLFFLNKNRIEKYWTKNNDISDLIIDNDLYGVKYYFFKKIDWQTQLGKDSALTFACNFNSLDVIKYFVEIGADFRYLNNEPIMNATFKGHFDTVKYLISLGIDIKTLHDKDLLSIASNYGHLEIVKYLVSLGADMTSKDYWPLRTAAINGHLNIIKYVVEIGIKFPVQYILKYAELNGHTKLIEYLEELIKNHSEISTDISGI